MSLDASKLGFLHDLVYLTVWQLADFDKNTVKLEKYECVVLHDD